MGVTKEAPSAWSDGEVDRCYLTIRKEAQKVVTIAKAMTSQMTVCSIKYSQNGLEIYRIAKLRTKRNQTGSILGPFGQWYIIFGHI